MRPIFNYIRVCKNLYEYLSFFLWNRCHYFLIYNEILIDSISRKSHSEMKNFMTKLMSFAGEMLLH